MTYTSNQLRVNINLDTIKQNHKNLRALTKTPIASVLKANGYGLGAVPIGKALYEAGCNQFFVATLSESLELREALPKATIYMLHGCLPKEVDDLVRNNITPVLNNLDELARWVEKSKKMQYRLPALVHFDTGMNRLGFDLDDAPKVQDALKYIDIQYVMSHLACADNPMNPYNAQQRERLLEVAKYFPGIPKSLSASEGISLGSDYYFDLIRVGISNYGMVSHEPHTKFAVRPQAQILQVRNLKAGETIGYGQTYTTPSPRRVGTVAIGFADGPMTRNISNRGCVYIGEYEAPLIGRISMGLSVIDLTDIPDTVAHPTVWVDLFRDNFSHSKLAEDSQLGLHEITCNIGRRFQKIYIKEQTLHTHDERDHKNIGSSFLCLLAIIWSIVLKFLERLGTITSFALKTIHPILRHDLLGPVLAVLVVAGRVGAADAAELDTMRVTEQVDALVTLSTNLFKYLVAPRVLVCTIAAVLGGYMVSNHKLGFNASLFMKQTFKKSLERLHAKTSFARERKSACRKGNTTPGDKEVIHEPSKTHVLLLEGGWNSESEVSLSSAKSVHASLTKQGYKVTRYNPTRDIKALCNIIEQTKPDIVFNGLHGLFFEDGRLQGILDILEVPYTHSNALASAIGMHKPTAKNVFSDHGIPVPSGKVLSWNEVKDKHPLPPPYVVKPIDEGSSVGVVIVQEGDDPVGVQMDQWPFGSKVLVEEFIPGQELSVAVMDNKAIGVLELRPKEGFYDFQAKYLDDTTEHIMPADIPKNAYEQALRYAEKAHSLLGCSGITRTDFRYDTAKDSLHVIEINTQPGFTNSSIFPEICAYYNISFDEIVHWLIDEGLSRATGEKEPQ